MEAGEALWPRRDGEEMVRLAVRQVPLDLARGGPRSTPSGLLGNLYFTASLGELNSRPSIEVPAPDELTTRQTDLPG